ncbi:MAG TPA: dienelactone hydrolase family protein [Candidatus Acidoferrales bacterium]|nr:dienelactone hydrolase family protein [Candidatus Acidoferrales bacterium]
MKVFRMLAAVICVSLLAASITVRADGPKTETVTFSNGKDTVGGFLATPEKPGRYPGLIVVHEWWGLNDWVKEQTVKLASQGFVALAVDLYRGKVAADASEAHELSRGLPDDRAIVDLMAGIVYLTTRNDVEHGRIGAIGWCMGGGYAVQLAMHVPRLGACVVNYGALPTDPNDLQNIGAPFLGNFGADDRGITPTDVQAFQKSMETLDRKVDIKIYDGAGHAFENPNNKDGYRPQAAEDAWNRTVAFLNKYLR